MYVPAHFEENRPEVLHQLIVDQPFGTLVTTGPNGLDANHLPFEFAADVGPIGTLRAHVAQCRGSFGPKAFPQISQSIA